MRLIHISDLHFHKDEGDNERVKSMLRKIKDQFPEHYLIVTGDITDDGNEKQYKNAFKELNAFKGKVFICPGNHDFGAAGNIYSKGRAKDFDKYLMSPLDQGGTFYGNNEPIVNVLKDGDERIMLIALDSNLETSHPFDFACGEIGDNQIRVLEFILTNPGSVGMKKILFFHHHPFIQNNPFMELKDAKELMRTIYGRIDVLMFGHKHKSNYWMNYGGTKHILASDNSPGENNIVREIVFESGILTVNSQQL